MKDIKKLLREGRKDVLPDESIKNNIKARLGVEEDDRTVRVSAGTAAIGRRGIIVAVCAAAAALVIALAVALPLLGNSPVAPPDITIDKPGKFDEITDSDTFYAYGAASVGAVIASDRSFASPSAATASAELYRAAPSDEQMSVINSYMSLVESLLSESDITGTAVSAEYGYDYGMSVGYRDMLGQSVSYLMYYDKIYRGGEVDGDEEERNYSIEGVLVVEGQSYPVEGSYSTESEPGEQENELFFRARTGDDSYIIFSRSDESENDDGEEESEYEYMYTLVEGGKVVERTTVEYESEEDELELHMTIERGGRRESLTFEDETDDGERVIAVSGDIDGERVSFRIYIRQGNYHYVFEDGTGQDFDRYDDDDDDRRRGGSRGGEGVEVWLC